MDNYYYKNGALWLRSKWPKKVKFVLILAILLLSLTFHTNTSENTNISDKTWHQSYVEYVVENNPKVQQSDARSIVFAAIKWASEYNLDPKLILAIAKVESNYYKHAISSSGAYGIMQVIPVWHKDKILEARKVTGNPEIFNINTNIYLGTRVLKDCMSSTKSNLNKALLCYAGQTPGYDKKVLTEYDNLKRL